MSDKPISERPRLARLVLAGLGVASVTVGQFLLLARQENLVAGLVCIGLGVVLFVWASLGDGLAWLDEALRPIGLSYRALAVAAACGLSLLATTLAASFEHTDTTNYMPVTLVWLAASAIYLAAFAGGRAQAFDWRGWWKTYGREALLFAAVFLLGVGLRFYRLGLVPRAINGDEGIIGQAALNTLRAPLANPFALFENVGALYLQGIRVALDVFGRSPFALRLLPAIGGSLSIVSVYLLGRWLFGRRVAVVAACLLAISHIDIHFSRTVAVAYIQDTWMAPLVLYLLISGLEKRSAARLALSGLVLGVEFSVYLNSQVLLATIIAYLLVAMFLCRPMMQEAARKVPVFFGGLIVAVLPEAVYAVRNPDQFLARLNSDGTFQSGWLQTTMVATGQSAPVILAQRVAHAFLSLTYYPAQDFYGATIPILDVLTAILFLLGLVYALSRTRNAHFLLLNGYFWAALLAVGIFAVPPSADSYRMLIALPAAVLLAALGLDRLLSLFRLEAPAHPAARLAITGLTLASILMLNTRAYFYDFAKNCRYGGDQQTRFASYLGNFLHNASRDATVYLLSTDVFQYGTHASVDFLSGELQVTNVSDSVDTLTPATNMIIVASPPRAEELSDWAAAHAGGSLVRLYDCSNLMLTGYTIPDD